MRALQPVVRRVAEQPRQVGVLLDDLMNETGLGVRGANRLPAPPSVHPVASLPRGGQDDRVLHAPCPGMGPAVPIISAIIGVRQSRNAAWGSPAGRRRK